MSGIGSLVQVMVSVATLNFLDHLQPCYINTGYGQCDHP